MLEFRSFRVHRDRAQPRRLIKIANKCVSGAATVHTWRASYQAAGGGYTDSRERDTESHKGSRRAARGGGGYGDGERRERA